jgi:hypothetical protein
LPAEIQKAYNGSWRPSANEWMSPKIIKTQKLYTWLVNVANARTGKGVGDMKHEELIGWIKAKYIVGIPK